MSGFMQGIHVFVDIPARKTWMAGDKPGHDGFMKAAEYGSRLSLLLAIVKVH
jgi:hypothetical protein